VHPAQSRDGRCPSYGGKVSLVDITERKAELPKQVAAYRLCHVPTHLDRALRYAWHRSPVLLIEAAPGSPPHALS